jgi:hypothetical protein
MRKENADFQTTFISHEGSELLNNDYFGYVVMDDIACYVIVDGIETGDGAASGRLAAAAGELMAAGNYAEAKKRLILARDIYAELRETLKLEEIRGKIEMADSYLTE